MLETKEVAERLNRPYSTIALWVRQGRFKNAESEDTPRGKVWWIPETDLDTFEPPKMGWVKGRKRKADEGAAEPATPVKKARKKGN